MNIGAAAKTSGLPVKTVRYYADIGLVTPGGAVGERLSAIYLARVEQADLRAPCEGVRILD